MANVRIFSLVITLFVLALASNADAKLVSCYTFDIDATDAQGIRNGTMVGKVSITNAARIGPGALNCSGGYVDLPGGAKALEGLKTLTICGWANVRAEHEDTPSAIFTTDPFEAESLHLYWYEAYQGGIPRFEGQFFGGGLVTTTEVAGVPTSWFHFAVVRDNSKLLLYINGELKATSMGGTATNLGVGAAISNWKYGTNRYFNGRIDDLRIYDHALTKEEINKIPGLVDKQVRLTMRVKSPTTTPDKISPSAGEHQFWLNSDVALRVPPHFWVPQPIRFDHWEGDVADPGAADTTIFMDGDKTVTAVYIEEPTRELVQKLENVEVYPIIVRAGKQFTQRGQYAVATISYDGPAISAGELFLTVSGNGEQRLMDLPVLAQQQTVSLSLSLPVSDTPTPTTLALHNKKGVLDSKEVQTQKPEPFTFYIMPSSHLCFGWMTGELTDHWGAAATIHIALDYLDKYPTYAFNIETAYFLKDFLDKYPHERHRVNKHLREGRLFVGGWMTPVQNIFFPEEETQLRQITMAQFWLKREFDMTSPVIIDFDAAGMRFQTAQMFQKSGVEGYFRGRYGGYRKTSGISGVPADPYEVFESPEGSSVVTFSPVEVLSGPYNTTPIVELIDRFGNAGNLKPEIAASVADLMKITEKITNLRIHGGTTAEDQGAPHCSAPAVASWNSIVEIPEVRYATISEFFTVRKRIGVGIKDIRSGQDIFWARLEAPAWMISRDVWQSSSNLLAAEKAATLDTLVNGTMYPRDLLKELWNNVMFLTHHEHMSSHIEENWQYDKNLLGVSSNTAGMLICGSLERLGHRVVRPDEGFPVVVWNLLSWDRRNFTEAVIPQAWDIAGVVRSEQIPLNYTALFNAKGQSIPCEVIDDGNERKLRFVADVPAMGYSLYYLREGDSAEPAGDLQFGEDFIENQFYRVVVDKNSGCLKSIYDKELGRELLEGCSNELRVLEDTGYDYKKLGWPFDHRTWAAENLTGKSWEMRDSDSNVSTSRSPFGVSIMVRGAFFGKDDRQFGKSREQVITLWVGTKRVDFTTRLDANDNFNCQVRLEHSFALENPKIAYDTQYGVINYDTNDPGLAGQNESTRTTTQNMRDVAHWISFYDTSNNICVSITVPALLNYFNGSSVSSLLLRRSGPEGGGLLGQAGRHTFRYSLTSGRGDWRDIKAYHFGRENFQLLEPLRVVFPSKLGGNVNPQEQPLSPCGSLMEVRADDVVLTTLKMAEQGYSVIARAYETEGKPSNLTIAFNLPSRKSPNNAIRFPQKIDFAQEVNLVEELVTPLDPNALKEGVDMKPFEIKTLRFGFSW